MISRSAQLTFGRLRSSDVLAETTPEWILVCCAEGCWITTTPSWQVGSDHAIAMELLPLLHKDPFDRILIAHAMVEGITLLTADPLISQYAGPIVRR